MSGRQGGMSAPLLARLSFLVAGCGLLSGPMSTTAAKTSVSVDCTRVLGADRSTPAWKALGYELLRR